VRRPAFLERSVTVNNRVYRYRVWLPARYTKLHHWPVILYLHGSGQRGDDNERQLTIGLAPALERYGQRYKAVVVLPQCAEGHEWYGDMEQMAQAALEQTIREFHGDRRRWVAVVPISGAVVRRPNDPFPTDLPPDIARIAYARDPAVSESRNMIAALKRRVGNVRYTEYPGVGHDAWDRAYADPNLAHWMLEQKIR